MESAFDSLDIRWRLTSAFKSRRKRGGRDKLSWKKIEHELRMMQMLARDSYYDYSTGGGYDHDY